MKDYAERLRASVVVMASGCHEWKRYRLPNGYGRTRYHGKNVLAHRLAWELAHGPIEPGVLICHRCDNPSCCNVEHLFAGSPQANIADMIAKGRRVQGNMKRRRIQKLTDAQVDEIRANRESGVALARRFGVTEACVSQIRNGIRKIAPRF